MRKSRGDEPSVKGKTETKKQTQGLQKKTSASKKHLLPDDVSNAKSTKVKFNSENQQPKTSTNIPKKKRKNKAAPHHAVIVEASPETAKSILKEITANDLSMLCTPTRLEITPEDRSPGGTVHRARTKTPRKRKLVFDGEFTLERKFNGGEKTKIVKISFLTEEEKKKESDEKVIKIPEELVKLPLEQKSFGPFTVIQEDLKKVPLRKTLPGQNTVMKRPADKEFVAFVKKISSDSAAADFALELLKAPAQPNYFEDIKADPTFGGFALELIKAAAQWNLLQISADPAFAGFTLELMKAATPALATFGLELTKTEAQWHHKLNVSLFSGTINTQVSENLFAGTDKSNYSKKHFENAARKMLKNEEGLVTAVSAKDAAYVVPGTLVAFCEILYYQFYGIKEGYSLLTPLFFHTLRTETKPSLEAKIWSRAAMCLMREDQKKIPAEANDNASSLGLKK